MVGIVIRFRIKCDCYKADRYQYLSILLAPLQVKVVLINDYMSHRPGILNQAYLVQFSLGKVCGLKTCAA